MKNMLKAPKPITYAEGLAEQFARLSRAEKRLKAMKAEVAEALEEEKVEVGTEFDTKYGKVKLIGKTSIDYNSELVLAQLKRSRLLAQVSESVVVTARIKEVAKKNDKVAAALEASKSASSYFKVL